MTKLVTGATGLVGCHVVEELCERARARGERADLRLVVRPRSGEGAGSGRTRLEGLLRGAALDALRAGELEVVEVEDLAAPLAELGPRLAPGLEGVVHLAARTDFGDADVARYRRINVDAARRMAELAAHAGCPLIHVSTAYVAGDVAGTFHERDLDVGQTPNNAYEASKLEGERAVRAACAAAGVPLAVFRPGVVLPAEPRAGTSCKPGPIVYLELLAALDARLAAATEDGAEPARRVVRFPGDPAAVLSLVPLELVVRVLADAIERPRVTGTYHVVAGRAFPIAAVRDALNAHLERVTTVVCPPAELADADTHERWVHRRCERYGPYLGLHGRHGRTELVRAFGADDATDAGWLERVCARHLEHWRGRVAARRADASAPARAAVRRDDGGLDRVEALVAAYFASFLADKQGVVLVPGLKSLSADFSVSVPGVGSWRLRIAEGRLEDVTRLAHRAETFDFELDAEGFLAVAAAETKPSSLFFQRRIRVRGNLFAALSTATALEEFFRLYPYRAARPQEQVS